MKEITISFAYLVSCNLVKIIIYKINYFRIIDDSLRMKPNNGLHMGIICPYPSLTKDSLMLQVVTCNFHSFSKHWATARKKRHLQWVFYENGTFSLFLVFFFIFNKMLRKETLFIEMQCISLLLPSFIDYFTK
jgi:hypothetical protein